MKTTLPTPHHLLLSLAIEDDGFLKDARFQFLDGLNVIIGSKGTAKTTALEFARFLLKPSMKRPKADLQVEANLGHGKIVAELQMKHGARYTAERTWDAPATHLRNGDGAAVDVNVEELFPYDYYGHHDIEHIAENHPAQLELLDRFAADKMRELETNIDAVLSELKKSADEMQRLHEGEETLRAEASDVKLLQERLKELQPARGAHGKDLDAAQNARGLRARERAAIDAAKAAITQVRGDADAFASQATLHLSGIVDHTLLDGANRDIIGALAADIAKLRLVLDRAVADLREGCAQGEMALRKQQQALTTRHAAQDEPYRQLLDHAKEEQGRTKDREALQEKLAAAMRAQAGLEVRESERRVASEKNRSLCARLFQLRHERSNVREEVASDLTAQLAPLIRVRVTRSADKSGFAAFLEGALFKSGVQIKKVVEKLTDRLSPAELASRVVRGDAKRLAEEASISLEQAEKVIFKLKLEGAVYALETVELGDVPAIELLDGKSYKASGKVSAGQRCTAILPIILLESDRPLVIDQPEDELAGDYLVDAIVRAVRQVKKTRQILFVTHNANLVVLGDAERVFVMASNGEHAEVHAYGTVEEMKEHVQRLLEGGVDAFLERKRRYGH